MTRGLAIVFSGVDDPRADNARHDLSEVLFIALAAVIRGAQGCANTALFGLSEEPLLRKSSRHCRMGCLAGPNPKSLSREDL